MIRYRPRDLPSLHPGSARPSFRRIAKITGRNDDMIILRGVNLFPTQIEEIALEIPELSSHFILELTKNAAMDHLTVKIEPREDVDRAVAEVAGKLLCSRVKERVGTTLGIEVVDPGSLPRSEGKLKRLYDLR